MAQARSVATWAAGSTAALAAALAAGIAYSAAAVDHDLPLPPAMDADRRTFHSLEAGELSYYADERGTGRPLALIHSVNAAASAYEMRPLFERSRGVRPVYALDLPGFGFSERGDRRYTPALYARAIADFLEQIGADRTDGADVVALSLGGEFVARAAHERPALVHSLALISPTGFGARQGRDRTRRGADSASYRLLAFPLWSQAFYDLLTSRASIRAFLTLCFAGHPDAGLVDYDYATAHRPGARFAPLRFVSGELFTPDVREAIYGRLTQPVLVLYDVDPFVRFDALDDFVRRHENWRAMRVAGTKGLPQFERPLETARALDAFWQRAPAPAAVEE